MTASAPDVPDLQSGTERGRGRAERLVTVSSIAIAAAALCAVIATGRLDYDEVSHAHAAWMVSQGMVPLVDFFEMHPPLPWYVLQHVFAYSSTPTDVVLALRVWAFAGTVLQLALLGAIARVRLPALPSATLALVAAVVCLMPGAIGYVCQFRVDPWAYAGTLGTILLWALPTPRRAWVTYLAAGALLAVSTAWSPKLALLPVLFFPLELARRWRARESWRAYAFGSVGGAALALSFVALALKVKGIPVADIPPLTLGYHALWVRHVSYDRTLAGAVRADFWPYLVVLLASLALRARAWLSLKEAPAPIELAVIATLASQWVLVPFPHGHYVVPWVLLGLVIVFHGMGTWSARVPPRALTAVLALTIVALVTLHASRVSMTPLAEAAASADALLEMVAPDQHVVVPPPMHPITRRDSFYLVTRSIDDRDRYGTEDAVRDLALEPYASRLREDVYLDELRRRPPAVIWQVWPTSFERGQRAAIARYVEENAVRIVMLRPGLYVDRTRVRGALQLPEASATPSVTPNK